MQQTETANGGQQKTESLDQAKIQVRLYGEEHEFWMSPQQTILEAAIEHDLDPPYSCQIGICGTCRAKLIDGEVTMDDREALTDEEIADGYILTCQAHPQTAVVVIDYDQ